MDLEADIARFLLLDLQVRLDRVIEGVGEDHAQIQRLDVVFVQIDHVEAGGDILRLRFVHFFVEDRVHGGNPGDAHVVRLVDHAGHIPQVLFQRLVVPFFRQHIHEQDVVLDIVPEGARAVIQRFEPRDGFRLQGELRREHIPLAAQLQLLLQPPEQHEDKDVDEHHAHARHVDIGEDALVFGVIFDVELIDRKGDEGDGGHQQQRDPEQQGRVRRAVVPAEDAHQRRNRDHDEGGHAGGRKDHIAVLAADEMQRPRQDGEDEPRGNDGGGKQHDEDHAAQHLALDAALVKQEQYADQRRAFHRVLRRAGQETALLQQDHDDRKPHKGQHVQLFLLEAVGIKAACQDIRQHDLEHRGEDAGGVKQDILIFGGDEIQHGGHLSAQRKASFVSLARCLLTGTALPSVSVTSFCPRETIFRALMRKDWWQRTKSCFFSVSSTASSLP